MLGSFLTFDILETLQHNVLQNVKNIMSNRKSVFFSFVHHTLLQI